MSCPAVKVVQVVGERWFIVAAHWSPCGRRIVIAEITTVACRFPCGCLGSRL